MAWESRVLNRTGQAHGGSWKNFSSNYSNQCDLEKIFLIRIVRLHSPPVFSSSYKYLAQLAANLATAFCWHLSEYLKCDYVGVFVRCSLHDANRRCSLEIGWNRKLSCESSRSFNRSGMASGFQTARRGTSAAPIKPMKCSAMDLSDERSTTLNCAKIFKKLLHLPSDLISAGIRHCSQVSYLLSGCKP